MTLIIDRSIYRHLLINTQGRERGAQMVGMDSEHRHQTTQRYSCPQAIPGDMESGLAPDRVQCMSERGSFRSEGREEKSGLASQCELRETSSCELEKERGRGKRS